MRRLLLRYIAVIAAADLALCGLPTPLQSRHETLRTHPYGAELWWSMIFSQTRVPLFRIMLQVGKRSCDEGLLS
jgi:hypothetical protein